MWTSSDGSSRSTSGNSSVTYAYIRQFCFQGSCELAQQLSIHGMPREVGQVSMQARDVQESYEPAQGCDQEPQHFSLRPGQQAEVGSGRRGMRHTCVAFT